MLLLFYLLRLKNEKGEKKRFFFHPEGKNTILPKNPILVLETIVMIVVINVISNLEPFHFFFSL